MDFLDGDADEGYANGTLDGTQRRDIEDLPHNDILLTVNKYPLVVLSGLKYLDPLKLHHWVELVVLGAESNVGIIRDDTTIREEQELERRI